MDTHELAWAAGFFDGEGFFGAVRNRTSLQARATLAQVDRHVLDRFRSAVLGIGSVTGPHRRGVSHQWQWDTGSFEGMQAVGALLWKFLSPIKREQFRVALERWHSRPRHRRRS